MSSGCIENIHVVSMVQFDGMKGTGGNAIQNEDCILCHFVSGGKWQTACMLASGEKVGNSKSPECKK